MTIQLHCSMQVSILSSSLTGYFNYLILGLRDKVVPPTSQEINKFPPIRVKNLATLSSIFIFFFIHWRAPPSANQRQWSSNGFCGHEATCLLTYARLLQYTRQNQRRGPTYLAFYDKFPALVLQTNIQHTITNLKGGGRDFAVLVDICDSWLWFYKKG